MRQEARIRGQWNVMYNLGALSFYFFWIVAVTGVYLFIFFETSINGAWQSVVSITEDQFLVGSLMRSLHRYATAGMVVTVTLHLIRELYLGRFLAARSFSWLSGIPLLWLMFASSIGGYWLIWDDRAQYIALTTAALFDTLPIVVEPMAFGFIEGARVSDRFFTLLIFLHVGIPLSLLLGMLIHIQRLSDSNTFPERGLAAAVLVALLVLSLVHPATSGVPADLNKPLQTINIDWISMNTFPLVNLIGPGMVWLFLFSLTGLLILLPFIVPSKRRVVATVDPDFCNGCGWCFIDCPYDAIDMMPHESRSNHMQSVVDTDKCVGCGICAGACPTATPFKSVNKAFSGINLVDEKNAEILARVQASLHEKSSGKVLVVGCQHGADLKHLESEIVATLKLECIGQLPPSYLDFLCRREGLEAVLLSGCASGNCFHRHGIEIQEGRLAHEREPHLRYEDVAVRVSTLWTGKGGEKLLSEEVVKSIEAMNNER